MVLTPTQAVAIEAKHSEPAYESVAQWLGKAADGNRKTVLEGWLALINETVGASLTVEQVAGCTYQLVHRTASACEPAAQRRAVVYQCFDAKPSSRDQYVKRMRELKALLGERSPLRFYLLDCPMMPSPSYDELCARWAGGERSLPDEVRTGLRAGRLLESAGCSVTRI